MKRAALVLLACSLSGCSRFMHFSDPSVDDTVGDLCGLLATQSKAQIDAEAARRGMSFTDIENAFKTACSLRVKQGLTPARHAGLAAARGITEETDAGPSR